MASKRGPKPMGNTAMTGAERVPRHKQRKRAKRLADYAALPTVSTWCGLEVVKLEAVLAAAEQPEIR
jgi:hypothetical protein